MSRITERYDHLVGQHEIADDAAQRAVLPVLDDLADWLNTPPPRNGGLRGLFAKPPEPPKGLYLWGGVGRGKSMLMDLFVAVVTAPNRRVHFHAFMQEIHAGLNEARKRGVDDALKPVAEKVAAEVRLLAFDEMQITDITDAMLVGRLFQMVMASGVVIVTTSNRVPDDLYKDGLNRALFLPFIDLLKQRMIVHHLHSDTDYRQGLLAGSQVYFSPAGAKARAALDAIWADLTGGEGAPLVLRVKGRDVTLPLFRDGVARMSFWDLCGRPLGAADYLAVVQAVRVLILEDIPLLSSENFNEAKRFVTLVDTLYEGGVRLIVSAAAKPERLYIEGEGTFEFERTASRLREMQGADWAAHDTA